MANSTSGYGELDLWLGFGEDGIYRSLRPPLVFPTNPNHSLVTFLFQNSSSYSQKPALIDPDSDESLSYSQLRSTVVKLAHGFRNLGIEKGDDVLIFAPNSILFPLCFLGITAIGAVATTGNYTVAEISKQIEDSKPKLVITVPELFAKMSVSITATPLVFCTLQILKLLRNTAVRGKVRSRCRKPISVGVTSPVSEFFDMLC